MVLVCLFVNTVNAQKLNQLKIGDTIPTVQISYLSRDNNVQTADLKTFYKNSFLIIDFWADWCGACIQAMANADSVAMKFNGKIKVLPMTYQDSQTIRSFVLKNKILKHLKFDYAIMDTTLMGGYFKFVTLPHEVWIDTQGIVKAITYADEINSDNIGRFIKNHPLAVEEKTDVLNFDIEAPLNVENNNFLYRAVLTAYKPGLSNIIGTLSPTFEKDFKEDKFIAINKDILSMFYAVFSQNNGNINYNRIELNVKDSLSLSPFLSNNSPTRQEISKHCYSYEFNFPQKAVKDSFYSYIMADLNILFPFKASIEKRKKTCWVFRDVDKKKNPVSLEKKGSTIWEKGFLKKMVGKSLDELISYFNWNMDLPVIDESNYDGLLTMDFELDAVSEGKNVYLNIDKVKKSIKSYGFDIIQAERFVDVLVVRDK